MKHKQRSVFNNFQCLFKALSKGQRAKHIMRGKIYPKSRFFK